MPGMDSAAGAVHLVEGFLSVHEALGYIYAPYKTVWQLTVLWNPPTLEGGDGRMLSSRTSSVTH